ncbi:TDT family transporter [Lysinibacillus sp. KU-BSD001]|uniref:TDT family transporter n=1 Tax=Lysinibacillus sp. KU-BSD001 TaxID=3141328 RepID=UPI0036F0A82C
MTSWLKTIPIPMSGLMLGLVSLAKLHFSLNMELLGALYFTIGVALFLLLLCKIIFTFSHVVSDLKNPIIASVAPTFSMGTMVMCSIVAAQTSLQTLAMIGWGMAACLQFTLVLYFTYAFVWKHKVNIQSVYPSWFIVYVGIGIIPITAGHFHALLIDIVFWIAFLCYVLLLPIVWKRIKHLEEPTMPLLTIIAAPGSLCLTAYLQHFTHPNLYFVVAILGLSQLVYVVVLWQLPKLLKLPFYPSYAAFTFPLVISATAMNTAAHFFHSMPLFHVLTHVELLIATCMVLYVLVRYLLFITANVRKNVAHGL